MEDIFKFIICNILIIGGVLGASYVFLRRIYTLIKAKIKGYKVVKGKVVRYIDKNSNEYIKQEQEKVKKKNPKLYEALMNIVKFSESAKETETEEDTSPAYFPVVEYIVAGKKYEIEYTVGRDYKGKKNKVMKIAYDPSNPKDAYFIYDNSIILGILALLMFAFIGYACLYW